MTSLKLALGSIGVVMVTVRSSARACSICGNVTKRNLLVSFRTNTTFASTQNGNLD
jgi:hypothetical protein